MFCQPVIRGAGFQMMCGRIAEQLANRLFAFHEVVSGLDFSII